MAQTEFAAAMPEARLTDELIESMRAKVGLDLRIDHSTWNDHATPIAVRKFADGIGDTNPLWRSDEHAESSPYGAPVAPPSFVIGCFSGLQFGWPGMGSFHAGTDIWFRRPVFKGDIVRASCRYDGFDGPKPSSFAGLMVVDRFTNQYVNQHGQSLAELKWTVINYERGEAKEKGLELNRDLPHRWSDDELADLEAEMSSTQARGSVPRWWEDVVVGETIDSLLKGPIGLTDEIAFVAGGGAPIPRIAAHRAALDMYRSHPEWSFRDPRTGALEPIYSVHYSRAAAQAMGVAMEYDVGFQRQCWQIQLLTDWIGDAGWVKYTSAQYRGFVYQSDVVRLAGKVVKKYLDADGEAVADLELWTHNQRGDDVMPGRATVALPSREINPQPVARRLAGRKGTP